MDKVEICFILLLHADTSLFAHLSGGRFASAVEALALRPTRRKSYIGLHFQSLQTQGNSSP